MLCEFCRKNEANVHLIKVINGQTEKINLCINCLRDFSLIPEDDILSDINNLLKKVLEVDIRIIDKANPGNLFENITSKSNKSCSFCGTDLNSVKSSGKVGCGKCYIEFRNEFIPILNNIHKSHQHVGKIPVKTSISIKLEKEIRDLENRLKHEIIVENFEEAARLRDTIKKLQKRLTIGKKTSI